MNILKSKKLTAHKFICLFFINIIYFTNVISRLLFSMFIPNISLHYQLSDIDIGMIYLLLSLGFGFSLFFSQFLSSKISHRATICISCFCAGIFFVFMPFISSWSLLKLFLALIGVSCGLFLPSAIALLKSLVKQENIVKSIGIFSVSQTCAFILAPIIGEFILANISPMSSFVFFGVFLILFAFSLSMFSNTYNEKGKAISLSFFKVIVQSKIIWIILGLHSLATGLNIGIYYIAPHYFLIKNHLPESLFFFVLSISRIIGILGSIFSGTLIDNIGSKSSIVYGLILSGIITLPIGLIQPSLGIYLLLIQVPIVIAFNIATFGIISKISPEGRNASFVSIFASCAFLVGAGVIPQVLSILSAWDIYHLGFIVLGCISIFLGYLIHRSDLSFEFTEQPSLE